MSGITGEQQKSCVVYTRQMTTHVPDLLNYSLALVMEQEANVAPSKVFSTKAAFTVCASNRTLTPRPPQHLWQSH
jgi:hypothetical protein